jgi:OPA family glycerol-3-phosphate transporter-like MFS transporter
MICIMVAIMFHGMLRDSVMTWMPSYISETYNLSNSAAILSGVVLPIFGLLCFRITEKVHRKVFPNLLTCAGAIFAVSTLAAAVLYFGRGLGAAVAILMLALIKGCMNGINLLFISILPTYFKKYGNISTVSGVLNSTTYVGSALSTYGIALISVQFGWSASTVLWMILGGVSMVLCLVCVPQWKKPTRCEL